MLCIPYFKHNLLSVQKLVKDNNCHVQFYPAYCDIIDNVSQKLVAQGHARNGLYYLSPDVPTSTALHTYVTNGTSSDTNISLALWHHRLGHAPLSKLKHIPSSPKQITPYTKTCVTCPMARFSKLPFPLSQSHATSFFDLVHLHIWGPNKKCSKGECRYFLIIVYDHTRYSWIYLLKLKYETLLILQTFFNYVQNHFNKSIKTLRSDNVLEFDITQSQQFFATHDIIHQTSCIRTSQQNARVERKHRYILETARALRFQANLPLSFWGDCVMTAIHLINRLSDSVLNFKTPYELLYKEPPTYEHLRIFGCLAFATNPQFSTDKFDVRGIPYVHLGYPSTKKGYRLLNLTNMEEFISRNVIFKEKVFPFQPNCCENYMQPRPIPMPNITSIVSTDDIFYANDLSPLASPSTHIPTSPSLSTFDSSHSTTSPLSTTEPIHRKSTRSHHVPL